MLTPVYLIANKKDITSVIANGDCAYFTTKMTAELCLHNLSVDGKINKDNYEIKKMFLTKKLELLLEKTEISR